MRVSNAGLSFLLLSMITNHAQKSLARQNDDDKAERAQQADQRRDGTHSNVEVSQKYCRGSSKSSHSVLVKPLQINVLLLGTFYAAITTFQLLVVLKNGT